MADIPLSLWECITLPLRIAYPVNVCPVQAEVIKAVGESPDLLRATRKQAERKGNRFGPEMVRLKPLSENRILRRWPRWSDLGHR